MAGHSKWSNIKHKKKKKDRRRAKIFNKLIREITVAAREQGGDPEFNPRLRLGMERAKNANMPKDNIENAIKRGTGELEGVDYEENTYEGYGPNGIAIFIEAMTDNLNRTIAELRYIFEEHDASLGEDGCVAWQFERRGLIQVDQASVDDRDAFLLEVIEMGGQEIEESTYELDDNDDHDQDSPDEVPVLSVYTAFESLHDVLDGLEAARYKIRDASPVRVATQTMSLDDEDLDAFLAFYEAVDDHDDVQEVYANLELDGDIDLDEALDSTG
jgi:YebC/PmpR family DNA-binding regulatory protein